MWTSVTKTLTSSTLMSILMATCFADPRIATSTEPAQAPSAPPIPWPTKIEAFRAYILQQPDQNATKGFGYGPFLRKTFDDGQCLQLGLYNWDCTYEIPYKMHGVIKWLDNTIPRDADPVWDTFRYYVYGYYIDPDDGWDFYGESRLSFGACGNRGPQSSCGVTWCTDRNGNSAGANAGMVPGGGNPYVNPNNRNRLCPWL